MVQPTLSTARDGLALYFAALRRHLWQRRALRALFAAVLLAGGLALAARVATSIGAHGATDALLLLSIVSIIGGAIWAFRVRPTVAQAARAADAELATRARFGTAAELLTREGEHSFSDAQLKDAWSYANKTPVGRVFGRSVPRGRAAGAAGVLATAVLAWVLLPDLSGQVAALLPKPAAPAAEALGREPLTDLERNNASDLQKEIDELKKRIANGEVQGAEAQKALQDAQSRLNAKQEQSQRQQQNLDNLADALRTNAAAQDVANAIDRGDYSGAAEKLNDLARNSDQLSDQAKRDLAKALDQAARDSQQNRPLSDAEKRAAQSMSRNDYRDTERSFRALGDEIVRSGQEVLPQSELGKANDQLTEARRQAGQEGQNGQEGQGSAEGQGGSPTTGGSTPGNQANGALPGNAPGQNQKGQGGDIQAGQNGQQVDPSGTGQNQPTGDLPPGQTDPRIGTNGNPLQLDGQDTSGEFRPGDGQGEQKGVQLGGARPAVGPANGSTQLTDPVDASPDGTKVAPDRRTAIRNYFNGQ